MVYSLPMDSRVKRARARTRTRISSKHQVTIPMQAMGDAGLRTGDHLRAEPAGRGRVLLIRDESIVERHAGTLTGAYSQGELDELRDEWD
jgi:bifunctional DNA-binding transcriptional regulator/antitoxin component of YhaV-PrlF toxin-antitoxin module